MVGSNTTISWEYIKCNGISHSVNWRIVIPVFSRKTNDAIWQLQWRHNGRDGVPNHQPHGCLLNRSFRRRSKETSKLRVTGLCAGNSPVTGELPAQLASNAENVSIRWRHHGHSRYLPLHPYVRCWVQYTTQTTHQPATERCNGRKFRFIQTQHRESCLKLGTENIWWRITVAHKSGIRNCVLTVYT